MDPTARFVKTYDVIRTNDELGVVYGWAAIFTENGDEYFDTQGDAIDPAAMEVAALDFAENGAIAGDLHEAEAGNVPFLLPITPDVREAFEMETPYTGLAIGMKPTAEVYEKFKSGEYAGFSIGGEREEEEVVEKIAKRRVEKGKFRQGKRRRMTKFRLDEISAVDSPAQVGARAVLMKRKGSPSYDPRKADPSKRGRLEKRAMLLEAAERHSHLLVVDPEDGTGARPSGFTSWEDGHQHPWIMLDDGSLVIGMADGHTHEPGRMSTGQEAAMQLLNRLLGESDMGTEADLEKRLARAEKVISLEGAQRAHFDKLEEKDQDAFLAKSAEDRKSEVDAAIEKQRLEDQADPVILDLGDGVVIRKSSDPVLRKLAERVSEDGNELEKLRRIAGDGDLRKRASAELGNLAGDDDSKVAVMKALESLPEDEREKALEVIKSGDAAMRSAFVRRGYGGASKRGDGAESQTFTKANDQLEKLADERARDGKITKEAARVQVEDENPELAAAAMEEPFDA